MLRRIGLVRPGLIGGLGAVGVEFARHHTSNAPAVVFAAVTVVMVGAALRERGWAVAALGVGATAAFATPSGMGPLLVATGVVMGARPALVDTRIAQWPEIIDAVVALPAV
ncbi:MAG: hypothetical protein H0U92_14805, partial [Actinobacteria bacterium]|nr:hypothetical protein [Actinomycetota bacterium]